MAWEWNFTSPYEDFLGSQFAEARKKQAQELRNYFSQNQIAQNTAAIAQKYGFLPPDVQVGAAMIGLAAESPEFTPIINEYLNKERGWWESIKAAGRGAIRGTFVGLESASQFVKRYGTAGMRYYNKKQQNPLLFFSGIGTAAALINPDFYTEVKNVQKETGPTLAGKAIREIAKGNKVNLGEGYFGNSTLAQDTELYKELVGRGADPDVVAEAIQNEYGAPISQDVIDRRERAASSYTGRRGTVKLSPGRVAAVSIFEPGSKAFKFMSGLIDGAYTIFTDPSTYVGVGLAKAGKAARTYNPNIKEQAGLINKAVRATVHQPTGKEFFQGPVGREIAELIAEQTTYDNIDIILKGQAKQIDGGASLLKKLRDSKDPEEISSLLANVIDEPASNLTQRLDNNSLIFKGKFSRAASRTFYGNKGIGFRTSMKLNATDSKWGRLFTEFPAPKLYANDLNLTFFELKDWMRWAKVDDDVAIKALDKLADGVDDETIKSLQNLQRGPQDPRPAKLANLVYVLDILGNPKTGVFPHIEKKFIALDLPPELVKGMREFMTSVDETRKYFTTNFGEEWFQGQKLVAGDSAGTNILAQQLPAEDILKILDNIATTTGMRKEEIGSLKQLQDEFLAYAEPEGYADLLEPEANIFPKAINSGGQDGVDTLALEIAEELGIPTGGKGMPGLTQARQIDGRWDASQSKLLKYNVEDTTEEVLQSLQDELKQLEIKMLKSNKRFNDSKFEFDRLSDKNKAAYVALRKKRDDNIPFTKSENERWLALNALARGGYKSLPKDKSLKQLSERLVNDMILDDTPSLLNKRYELEQKIDSLLNQINVETTALLNKGILDVNPTDQQIQNTLKRAIKAKQTLESLNVKLQGKNFKGQTQEGKRIKETSVNIDDLGVDRDRPLEDIITEFERIGSPIDFAGDYKVVYYVGINEADVVADPRILRSAIKVAEYPRGTTDAGVPRNNLGKPILPEGASIGKANINKTYQRIEYDNFDIDAYRQHEKAGGEKVKMLRAELKQNQLQLLQLDKLGDMKGAQVQKYIDLNEQIAALKSDPGAVQPNARWYAKRSTANVDNTDVTIVVFNKNKLVNSGRTGKNVGTLKTLVYASRNRWVRNDELPAIVKDTEKFVTGVFKDTLNKPLILIEENTKLTDEFILEARKLINGKTVNVAGSRDFKNKEKLSMLLKPIFMKGRNKLVTKEGRRVIENNKLTPQQILDFFQNRQIGAGRKGAFEVSTAGDELGKKFSALNATFREGRYAGRTIEDVYQNSIKNKRTPGTKGKSGAPDGSGQVRPGDFDSTKNLYEKLWEEWALENPESMNKLAQKVNEGFRLVDSKATKGSIARQDEALTNVLSKMAMTGFPDEPQILEALLTQAEIQNVSKIYEQPTAQLIAEYLASDAIPMPDSRMFLRVYSPAREFFMNLTGKRKLIDTKLEGIAKDEFISSEFEKELSKPLSELYKLTVKPDKSATEYAQLFVKNARKQFKIASDDETVRELTAGYLGRVGDGFMNKAWKPLILLRAAWTSRVVGEEQVRMWMANLDNVFSHPLSAFAWIMGKDRKKIFHKMRGFDDDEVAERLIARGVYDIQGDVIGENLYHQSAMTKTHGGVLEPFALEMEKGFERVRLVDDGFIDAAATDIMQLSDDPLAAEIAYRLLGSPVDGFESTIDGNVINQIKKEFFEEGSDLSQWRYALTNFADEPGKYGKARMLTDKNAADGYIEGILARLHYKTGGHFKTFEEFADGSRILLTDSKMSVAANPRTRMDSIIRHEITQPGDKELLEHIAFGREVQRATQFVPRGKPQLLQIGDERITFGRTQTLEDHRKYKGYLRKLQKDRAIYGDNHVMKRSVHTLSKERISTYDKVIEGLFTGFMAIPTNRLSRSSAFRQFYWKYIEGNAGFYDDALREEIIKAAEEPASKWVKNSAKTAKILRGTKIEDASRTLGADDLAQLDEMAKSYALTETQKLLYDLNKRHAVSDMLRLAFPFAEVYLEILGTWSRLINQQKLLSGRKVQRVIQGARGTGEEGEEGFFHTDEQSGEEMFFFPGTELLTNFMFGEDKNQVIKNPATGEMMEAPDVRLKLEGYASSLNMVAGNPMPGLGPLVAIPAGGLLPDTQIIDKLFFPYGRLEEGVNPYTFLEQSIPSWLKKVLSMGKASSPQVKRTYANTYKDVLRMLITTGLYDDSTPEKQQAAMEEAKKIASRLTWIRSAVQFAAPTGAVVRYEIETTPGGALYLDPAKFKEEDPDGHYFGMSLYADAYYRILAKYGGDQLAATVEFVNQFGVDPTALLTSKSKEVRKRSYTEEGGRFTNSNKDLLKRYPNIGYYMFPDNPLDEFDFNSWTESFAERDRIDLSEEEYVSAVRNGQGRLAYEYQRRLLFDTPMYANIPSSQKFEMLTAVRNALRQEYPGYGTGSTVPTALNVEAKIAELESMLANDYNTKVKLPDGKSVPLNELPAISGVIKYLEQRNRLLSEARLVLGSNVSLQKEQLFNARAQLRKLAQELFSTNPDFYYIYLDLFKYEVEEKYNETTFYGGNR